MHADHLLLCTAVFATIGPDKEWRRSSVNQKEEKGKLTQRWRNQSVPPEECPNRIRLLRFEKGITAGELARRVDTHPAHMLNVERGRENLGVGLGNRIAEALGVRLGDLHWRLGEHPDDLAEESEKEDDGNEE